MAHPSREAPGEGGGARGRGSDGVLSGGRSCSRTAGRRLGAARREPRGAGGRRTPAWPPAPRGGPLRALGPAA